jgi:hypothetical protein
MIMGMKVLNFQVLDGKIQGTFEIPFYEILAAAQTGNYSVTGIEAGSQGWVVHLAVPLESIALVEAASAPQNGAVTSPVGSPPPQTVESESSSAPAKDPVEAREDPLSGPAA